MTRGTWTLDEAIELRWTDAGLDASFRGYWSDSTITEYPTLSEGEAPAGQPGPYCVYHKGVAIADGYDGGETSTTYCQRYRIRLTFTIHAKNSSTQTAKAIAKELAALVAAAYDWEYGYLRMSPDSHVKTERITDYAVREDHEEYAWVIEYEITIEAKEVVPDTQQHILTEDGDYLLLE